jgi:hypothetical protein
MLSGLTRRLRLKAALGLVALYAFCVLAPHAAVALGNIAAHCLTEDRVAAHIHNAAAQTTQHAHDGGTVHQHADGTMHRHAGEDTANESSDTDRKTHSGNCCGLFCISAIPFEAGVALPAPPAVSTDRPALCDALAGRGPDRINRPPIA